MKNIIARPTFPAFLVLLFLVIPAMGSAHDRSADSPFWWDLGMGYGSVGLSHDERSADYQDALYLGFKGGLKIDEGLRLGVDVSTWTMESADSWDSERGEGLASYGLVAMLTPPDTGLQLTAGFGYVDYWNNRFPGYDGDGWAGTVGIGYSFGTGLGLSVTPSLSYTFGRIRDDDTTFYDPYYDEYYENDPESRTLDIVTLKVSLSFNTGGRSLSRDW